MSPGFHLHGLSRVPLGKCLCTRICTDAEQAPPGTAAAASDRTQEGPVPLPSQNVLRGRLRSEVKPGGEASVVEKQGEAACP